MTLLMGSMSCQNSLKMHFCSCDSGMSLILEVDVASATETTISILLLRDAKQPMAFAVWLLNLRWRCVDTSWINLWIQLLSLEKVVIRCADGWSVETQTSSVQNVCLYIYGALLGSNLENKLCYGVWYFIRPNYRIMFQRCMELCSALLTSISNTIT